MAVATIPKSEMRRNHDITVGYAVVPAREDENGSIYWGLPGGVKCDDPVRVRAFAVALDRELRRRVKDVRQLIHRDPTKAKNI